jgi:hypothetical protein
MSQVDITTGVQAVSAVGAVTGTIDVSALTGDFTVRGTITGLGTGQKAMIAIEDTAGSTPFSDALAVAVFHVEGALDPAGTSFSKRLYEIPLTLHGATNNKLRVNVYRITGGATFSIHAWLDE